MFFDHALRVDDRPHPVPGLLLSTLLERSWLGVLMLERAIAERGRYPAVNVLRSISRTMPQCVPVPVRPVLQKARETMSVFSDMEELIRLGAYRKGSDPGVDRAISLNPAFEAFLGQQREERTSIADGYVMLGRSWTRHPRRGR